MSKIVSNFAAFPFLAVPHGKAALTSTVLTPASASSVASYRCGTARKGTVLDRTAVEAQQKDSAFLLTTRPLQYRQTARKDTVLDEKDSGVEAQQTDRQWASNSPAGRARHAGDTMQGRYCR
eukprot:SAG22_NODE_465_length_10181_cov_6.604444_19_plen_122_part_00